MPSNCTECLETLQNSSGCRRQHQKCTEPSLTPQQERVWQAVRDLPGVRLRQTSAGQQLLVLGLDLGPDLALDVGLRRALALGLKGLALALGLTALALLLGS